MNYRNAVEFLITSEKKKQNLKIKHSLNFSSILITHKEESRIKDT